MASKKILIIGISGTTSCGKSSLTSRLSSSLPQLCHTTHCTTMSQDDYFREPGDPAVPHYSNGMENWDCLAAIRMDKMVADVHKWKSVQEANRATDDSSYSLLLIEGFIIFNDRQLTQLFDKKYFIKLDYSTSAARRIHRTYDPPDPPGYFDAVAWPEYSRHLDQVQDQKDIDYIDGCQSLDSLHKTLLTDLQTLLV